MTDIDRHHAERLMQEAGIDALALFQPEAFRYAVGAPAGVAMMWGRAGPAIALVPADHGSRIAAVASDHAAGQIRKAAPDVDLATHRIWIDMVDLSALAGRADVDPAAVDGAYRDQGRSGSRPETFDRSACFSLLGDILDARGLAHGRIGVDLEFMPAADFDQLKRALPEVRFTDGSEVLRRLRAVKSPREIECLRRAAMAAEGGLSQMAAIVAPGVSLGDLSAAWKDGAQATAAAGGFSLSGHWDFISVGPDLSDMNAVVKPGALIKADVGTLVDGYSSDGARTFCFGPPAPLAQRIFAALENAFAAGLDVLKPGNRFGAVHAAMLASMRRDGFTEYFRGHFGHSVGGSVGIEEWPFFSANSPELILPGMVVALEAPFYAQGLGALMIEDQFLVTQDGVEPMNRLSRGLRDLSAQ
ncbi:aminopeptidase P family protein [Rhizobium sp. KAs_5_22]|uniref:M24 family metallopeptidase n=1 Tax=Ciceribacter selenitireducens TaxID=448181 RepID=UPI0004911EB7|nr:Xaa-Pro peptidase family protein [Ciceribacter selenitireducens]PPJ45215.1 aminopeptidase P family protein [Rhizobium sp. KAs_5_22]